MTIISNSIAGMTFKLNSIFLNVYACKWRKERRVWDGRRAITKNFSYDFVMNFGEFVETTENKQCDYIDILFYAIWFTASIRVSERIKQRRFHSQCVMECNLKERFLRDLYQCWWTEGKEFVISIIHVWLVGDV